MIELLLVPVVIHTNIKYEQAPLKKVEIAQLTRVKEASPNISTIEPLPEPIEPIYTAPIPNTPRQAVNGSGGLVGSIGYARPSGNCVREPGVKNPGWGNPIDWPVATREPYIGATALWTYNHTGVVVGIWSNGDIEVRHQNYSGGQTRFKRSDFRGFI